MKHSKARSTHPDDLSLVRLVGAGLALAALVLTSCSAGSDQSAGSTARSAAPTSTSSTTTSTISTTTTTVTPPTSLSPSTTTTPPVALAPTDYRTAAIAVWDASLRQGLINTLGEDQSVQSVDLVLLDPSTDTVVIDITSTWESFDRQHDAAWEITRALAALWEANEHPVFRQPGWSPSFRLINSGATYACSADFMARLADVLAARSDWQAECVVALAPEVVAPTPVTPDPARAQLEADVASQRATVASLETAAALARSDAEVQTPVYEARIANAESFGAVQGAAAGRAELDAMWAEVNRLETELASARTVLAGLESRL